MYDVQKEMADIEETTGKAAIPPERFATLFGISNKIVTLLTDRKSSIFITYRECLIVLDMVKSGIERVKEAGNNGNTGINNR